MKLTDAQVAKALGWYKKGYFWNSPRRSGLQTTPKFTTSLDAIVAEVEARGLQWGIAPWLGKPGFTAVIMHPKKLMGEGIPGPTAPLALCAALLAYLKEAK